MKKLILAGLTLLILGGGTRWAQVPDNQVEPPEILEGRGEYEMILIHGLGASSEIWNGLIPYLQGTFNDAQAIFIQNFIVMSFTQH